MRHVFSHDHDAPRTCICHGWSRARVIEDLPQHEALPLVGLAEIAMRAGVQKPVVAMWRTKRVYFPEPVAQVGRSAVWWWPDVEAWLEATGRETAAG